MQNTARVHRLTQAVNLIGDVLRSGGRLNVSKSSIRLENVSSTDHSDLNGRIYALREELRELLDTPKKDWAEGRREIAIAAYGTDRDIEPKQIAAIELLARRNLGRALFLTNISPSDDLTTLREFVGDAPLLVAEASFGPRAALGLALAIAGIGRGRQEIWELPISKTDDYRNWLAGSAFLDVDVPSEFDVSARALRTALAARALKKDIPKSRYQAFYSSMAAKALSRKGIPFEGIRARIKVSGEVLGRWLDMEVPQASREDLPTGAMLKYAYAILEDLPFLRQALPPGWEREKTTVKTFLDAAGKNFLSWRTRWRELEQGEKLRSTLARGEPLDVALSSAGLSESAGLELIRHNQGSLYRDFEADIAKSMAVDITLPDLR